MTELEDRAPARAAETTGIRVEPIVGWFGVASALATAFGIALIGSFPDDDDGGAKLAQYYADHRGALLAASICLALGAALGAAFWVGLRSLLRGDALATLAGDIGAASAIVVFAMGAACMGALQTGAILAGRHGGLDPALANTLTYLVSTITNLSAAPTLVLAAAFTVAIRRTNVVASWLATALAIVGVAHILALLSVTSSGAFAPGGATTYLGPILYLVWMIVGPITLLRRR